MQQTVSSTRTCSEFVQEHVVPCLVSALLKRQIYEIVHLSQGGLTEGFFCHFLISFNRVYFFSSSFLPSLTAVWVWVCDCVREGGIGKSSPLLHWQLLIRSGAEKQDITRQPISLWIMSYLSLCPAFPFRYTFLFFFTPDPIHSGRQVLKVGRQGGCTHITSSNRYRTPPVNHWEFIFCKERPIIKGDSQHERLQGLFKSLKGLKLWFPTGIYYHVLLLVPDVTRVASSVSVSANANVAGRRESGLLCLPAN